MLVAGELSVWIVRKLSSNRSFQHFVVRTNHRASRIVPRLSSARDDLIQKLKETSRRIK
jgi:hypothetical protein